MLIAKTTILQKRAIWTQPTIVASMFKNLISQDPLPLFSNSECYYLKSENSILSYCVFSEHKDFYHLKDVFTFPQHRQKGFASNLLKRTLTKLHKPVYLLCKATLIPFYQNLGFIRTKKVPRSIRWKRACGNFMLQITERKKYYAMIRN